MRSVFGGPLVLSHRLLLDGLGQDKDLIDTGSVEDTSW